MTPQQFSLDDAFQLRFKLRSITGYEGMKFNYAIARNLDKLDSCLKTIMQQTGEAQQIKDEAEKQKKIDEINSFAKSEKADFEPYKIKVENLPANLKTEHMTAIFSLIDGEPQ